MARIDKRDGGGDLAGMRMKNATVIHDEMSGNSHTQHGDATLLSYF